MLRRELHEFVLDALYAARDHEESDAAVLAFIEQLEDHYSGDMVIEAAIQHLAEAVRAVA